MATHAYPRTLRPPSESFFLFGIRGVGKSTWAPTQGGTEVDFLIWRGKSFVAVEVKTTANPASPHFAGLSAIADLTGVKRRVLVHIGERSFNTPEGIEDPGRSPAGAQIRIERNDDDDLLASTGWLARP